jgi:hypothetical protein
MGVPSDEMGGCIFDQGYLNIPPNVPPTPNIPSPTTSVLNKVERPALNNNAHTFSEGKYPNDRPQTISTKPEGTTEKPQTVSKESTEPKPSHSTTPRPSSTFDSKPSTPSYTKPSTPSYSKPSTPSYSKPSTPSAPAAPRPSAPVTPKPSVPTTKGKG